MTNLLDNSCGTSDEYKHGHDVQAAIVAEDFKLTRTGCDEILLSNLGHVRTDSRVTLKRVSYTSHSVGTGKKITVVHSSTVSTTRSGSSPSEVTLPVDFDGHAVLGLDLFNQVPRSGDLFGWVNDLDALIKEQNVGFEKEQISTNGSGAADCGSQQDVAAVEKALNNESGKEGDQNPATGNGASGSKLFTIRHFASFSQMGSTK